ncbi:MAG TPA: C25 family cysteine peptidase [Bacteroidales bacterium]|nr:C25 family cysteine peptidase [Bacteroidales bacterium]HSA44450.1 C25 family cysteine peptidase [Bacteroidales bacterium]
MKTHKSLKYSSYILILSLSLLMVQVRLSAGMLEKTYQFPAPELQRSGAYTSVAWNGCQQSGLPGQPALPWHEVSLLLPAGERAVRIEFTGEDLLTIPGAHLLWPSQPDRPLSDLKRHEFLYDKAVYNQAGPYPASVTGILTTQYLYGNAIALCTFTPVVYFPAERKLQYYSRVRIRVYTEPSGMPGLAGKGLTEQQRFQIGKLVQNQENLPWIDPPAIDNAWDYQVLIIAPELFLGQFDALKSAFRARGMKTQVMAVPSILAAYPGTDNPEKIRNCIIQQYQQHDIRYVLLAGDAEHVPFRGMYCYVQSGSGYTDNNIPADIYYAALDGNWNTDGDNLWGEPGEEDLLPELAVGRFCVSSVAELQNAIGKTLMYQHQPVAGDFRRPLMAGEKLWENPETWGGDYLDLLIGFHNVNGYATDGIPAWHDTTTLYDRDLPSQWTALMLRNLINQGTSFLHHAGHASTNYLMRMSNSAITNANFSQVNGTTHGFVPVYSHGCYCAAFDESDCIAEKMLNINNFAVAFIGNSRFGWFNEGQTEGPSQHLHREFVNALYAVNITDAGRAHSQSKISSAPWVTAPGQWEEGALRWCFYGCNLLGDPALSIWTEIPLSLDVTHPATIPMANPCILVQCDTSGSPAAGLTCIILADTALLASGITDSTGHVTLCIDTALAQTGPVLLIVSGPNCIPDTSVLTVTGGNSLAGNIRYFNNNLSPMENVMLCLMQQGDTMYTATTDSAGQYHFQNVLPGTYEIKASCTAPWGGGNSSDALMILKHFVGLSPLSGMNLEAADVDNNGYINSVDAFYVQKRFVGIISSFPAGDWVFETNAITLGLLDNITLNIKGLCVGDVNGSFFP